MHRPCVSSHNATTRGGVLRAFFAGLTFRQVSCRAPLLRQKRSETTISIRCTVLSLEKPVLDSYFLDATLSGDSLRETFRRWLFHVDRTVSTFDRTLTKPPVRFCAPHMHVDNTALDTHDLQQRRLHLFPMSIHLQQQHQIDENKVPGPDRGIGKSRSLGGSTT